MTKTLSAATFALALTVPALAFALDADTDGDADRVSVSGSLSAVVRTTASGGNLPSPSRATMNRVAASALTGSAASCASSAGSSDTLSVRRAAPSLLS